VSKAGCLLRVLEHLQDIEQLKKIKEHIEIKQKNLAVFGLNGSDKAVVMASLINDFKKPVCILTKDKESAKALIDDLTSLCDEDIVLYDLDDRARLIALSKLIKNQKITVVATVEAAMHSLVTPDIFKKAFLHFSIGDQIELEKIKKQLIYAGYQYVEMLEACGQFCVRGGILDIYPKDLKNPVRIELWGEEIESIYLFNLPDQKILKKIRSIDVIPASEVIIADENKETGKSNLKLEFDKHIKQLYSTASVDAYNQLKAQAEKWLEQLDNFQEKNFKELLPFFYSDLACLIDYFPEGSVVLFDDVRQITYTAENIEEERNEAHKKLVSEGKRLPSQVKMYVDWKSICRGLKQYVNAFFSCLPFVFSDHDCFKEIKPDADNIVSLNSKPVPYFYGRINLLAEEIKRWNKNKKTVVLLLSTAKHAEGLAKELNRYDVGVTLMTDDKLDQPLEGAVIAVSNLNFGFELALANLVIVTEREILSKTIKRGNEKHSKKDELSIEKFKTGDYVVHLHHGIGRYEGIVTLCVDEMKKDYMLIKYAGEDRIYVPVDQVNLLQRYVGNEGVRPKLSKIGSTEWMRAKARAKKAAREIAKDLLELYAKRQKTKGYAFSKDTVWQREFEQKFPYKETPDQLKAIEDVKRDMESPKPMDRLICGDVGYGKTEIALRAAFKAVNDGKQVAVLVPTTVLAQQHYRTFKERFADFPVRIEVLSRLKSRKAQQDILKRLKSGSIDIIVGTHRLLQSDVNFKDLGLLIIDEEQRFGVNHKEKLKKLRVGVDVLTLTATPIPRTLHMSLVGIRDTSLLNTPPEDRLPVQTYVLGEEESIIKEVIQNEIDRGGQVFFVHNRVEELEEIVFKLKKLVPEAKVTMAHGRMPAEQLEKAMVDFVDGVYNVLVCTTIIENGLDLPDANTLIVKDAENFGLAQLYQLRGRVGRSSRQAYAYLMFRRDKILSELAEKRLLAIKEFTDFGSGYKIAMRDLQLRGAGNILGIRQHGHIAEVGFSLYCKMLEQAIKEAKGEIVEEEESTIVDIPIDAHIPDWYIRDQERKVELYHYIAGLDNEEEVYELKKDLEQQFGDIPDALSRLLLVAVVRILSTKANIKQICFEKGCFIFKFDENVLLDMTKLLKIIEDYKDRIRFVKHDKGFEIKLMTIKVKELNIGHLESLIDFVRRIGSVVTKQKGC